MKTPEQYRLKKGQMGSDASYGANGFFVIPHPKIANYEINCMISDGMGWDHVSVTLSSPLRKVERCPTWEEMCFVKSVFWNPDDVVVQYHPAESDYVSCHHYCLHLWKVQDVNFPVPDPIMVGHKSKQRL